MHLPRSLLIAVAAFSLGTVVTTVAAAIGSEPASLSLVTAGISAVALVGWLIVASRPATSPPPRWRLLVASGVLNAFLVVAAAYLLLGLRADSLHLASRTEGALSLLSPRFLRLAPVNVARFSYGPTEGGEAACAEHLRSAPVYLRSTSLLETYDFLGASVARAGGPEPSVVVLVYLRDTGLSRLRAFARKHPGNTLAFTVEPHWQPKLILSTYNADDALRENPLVVPFGSDRAGANRFLFWLRRQQ